MVRPIKQQKLIMKVDSGAVVLVMLLQETVFCGSLLLVLAAAAAAIYSIPISPVVKKTEGTILAGRSHNMIFPRYGQQHNARRMLPSPSHCAPHYSYNTLFAPAV